MFGSGSALSKVSENSSYRRWRSPKVGSSGASSEFMKDKRRAEARVSVRSPRATVCAHGLSVSLPKIRRTSSTGRWRINSRMNKFLLYSSVKGAPSDVHVASTLPTLLCASERMLHSPTLFCVNSSMPTSLMAYPISAARVAMSMRTLAALFTASPTVDATASDWSIRS